MFDVDDADICDPRTRDAAIECGSESQAIIVSNQFLYSLFSQYNQNTHSLDKHLPVPTTPKRSSPRSQEPVVVWAQLDATSWLYESEFVRDVVGKLRSRGPVRFLLIGEGNRAAANQYVQPLSNLGVECRVLGRLRYRQYISALSQGAVGLNPSTDQDSYSRGRSSGKVLGYMLARVPIVTANNSDYSQFFVHGINALVAKEADTDTWVEYCRELLEDESLRERLTDSAVEKLQDCLSTTRAVQSVDRILREELVSATGPHETDSLPEARSTEVSHASMNAGKLTHRRIVGSTSGWPCPAHGSRHRDCLPVTNRSRPYTRFLVGEAIEGQWAGKRMAAKAGCSFKHLPACERLEDNARTMAEQSGIKEGLVCVHGTIEACCTFRVRYIDQGHKVGPDRRVSLVACSWFHSVRNRPVPRSAWNQPSS